MIGNMSAVHHYTCSMASCYGVGQGQEGCLDKGHSAALGDPRQGGLPRMAHLLPVSDPILLVPMGSTGTAQSMHVLHRCMRTRWQTQMASVSLQANKHEMHVLSQLEHVVSHLSTRSRRRLKRDVAAWARRGTLAAAFAAWLGHTRYKAAKEAARRRAVRHWWVI